MKPPPVQLLAPACFALFAFAGWQAGGEKISAPASAAAPAPSKHSERGPRTTGKGGMPADVRERLAAIHAARTPDDLMRATLALAHSLPVSEMERWYVADWFDFHDSMAANLFYRITRARWLEADPAGLMGYLLRRNDDKTGEMAGLWAQRDPHAALAFMESAKHPGDLERLASGMAGALAAADPALAVAQVMKLQAIFGQQGWAISSLIGELAKHSPALLESESAAWPASLQKIAETQLVAASLKRDFAAGIAGLNGSPDGKKRFLEALDSNSDLAKEMAKHPDLLPPGWFAEAASANPYYIVGEDPGKWLGTDLATLGFSDEQAKRLRNNAMSYLGSKDPERAMEMLAGDDLDSSQRLNLLSNALSNLAGKDKAKAEEWAARLTDPQEIEQARQAIENASNHAAGKSPPAPADWLAGLADKDPGSVWQYIRQTQAWDSEQVATATREFRDLPAEQKSDIAAKLVNRTDRMVPVELRAEAIGYMLESPPPADASTGESGYWVHQASGLASSWGSQDPLAAGRWVSSLPEGEARLWAAKNLAAQWAEYEPAAARQWAAGLPAAERGAVADYLDQGGASKP